MLRFLPFGPSVKSKCLTNHAARRASERLHRIFNRKFTQRDSVGFVRDAAKAAWIGLARVEPCGTHLFKTFWRGVKIVSTGHPSVNGEDKGFCVVTIC